MRGYPGVHAVGIGEKYVGGKSTGETSILVLVTKKKPADQLKPEEVVPLEIEGIKTDVIEVPMPQLSMASNPANISKTISPDQHSVTFAGQSKPGPGILIAVEFTASPAAAPGFFTLTHETGDDEHLEDIARSIATRFTDYGGLTGLAATSGGTQVTITPPMGLTIAITDVPITAIDDAQYFDQWVRGGIQIALAPNVHGSGTLGCLATTASTADDPQGKVVAITNHHVVRPDTTWGTNLVATRNPAITNQILFASNDGQPITAGTVLEVTIFTGSVTEEALYLAPAGKTVIDVANGAAAVITALSIPGVVVAPSASTLAISGASFNFQVRGPLLPKGDFRSSVSTNTVTFGGEIDGDDYGIFLDIHPGGIAPSFGIFANPPKNTNSDGMATLVFNAFQNLPATVRGSVTMSQAGSAITLANAELIESRITNDIRVGQPDPSFGSSCCHCCSHRIGRVLDARFDLDVALIQLDPDQKYKPEIQDLGLVAGVEPPAQPMTVYRRGRTTQRTNTTNAGLVRGLNVSGAVANTLRFYNNSFLIQAVGHDPFTVYGDSGSAIVDLVGKVVGIGWGGQDAWGYATPIDLIVAAFPALALNLAPAAEAGHAATDVRTVPHPAARMEAAPESLTAARPVMIGGDLQDRLLEAEKEVAAAPAGREYAHLIRSHFDEGQRLINRNRKVATAWHRNGGPELLQAIFRMIQRPDQRLPLQFNGKPWSECLSNLLRVMAHYASPRLSADLEQHAPRLAGLAGLSYNDVLNLLQSWSEER